MMNAKEMRELTNVRIEEEKRKENERIAELVETVIMEIIEENANAGKFFAKYYASTRGEAERIVNYLRDFDYDCKLLEQSYGIVLIKW